MTSANLSELVSTGRNDRLSRQPVARVWIARPHRTLYLLPAATLPSKTPLMAFGRYMQGVQLAPDLVILAGGQSAQDTWSGLEDAFADIPPLWMEPHFDTLSIDEQMDVLRAAPAGAERILVIADAPVVALLAGALARGFAPARPRAGHLTPVGNLPRGALAVVTLPLHRWDGLAARTGAMKAVLRPEDLEALD